MQRPSTFSCSTETGRKGLWDCVTSEGCAGVRQEGGDNGASTPAPVSLTFHVIKNKGRAAHAEHNNPHQKQALTRACSRLPTLPRPKQDGSLRSCSQHSVEFNLTLKLSWFPLTCIHVHICVFRSVCAHIHVYSWPHS